MRCQRREVIEMLGPAYAIPILRKGANHELREYVKAEFNDHECHWFNSRYVVGGKTNRVSQLGRLLAKLRRPEREPSIAASPTLVPCAAMVGSCRKEGSQHARDTDPR